VVSAIFFLATNLFVLLNSKSFQNYFIHKIEKYYSEELKTTLHIDSVAFTFYKFDFYGVSLNDQQQDSLCRIKKLTTYIDLNTVITRNIVIHKIVLDEARLNFMVHPGVKGNNLDFIRKYFSKKHVPDGPKKPPFIINIKDVELINSLLSWSDKRKKPDTRQLDLNYMEFRYLNAKINKIKLIDDSINCKISDFNFIEKCGWRVTNVESSLAVSDKGMLFDNFSLTTPYSKVGNKLKLSYNDYEDLEDFVDSVKIDGHILTSKVGGQDLAYFNEIMKGITENYLFSGNIKGPVSNLRIMNTQINYGAKTVIKGNIYFIGLPDVEKTHMSFDISQAATQKDELEKIMHLPALPAQIAKMGSMDFVGNFKGYISDFTLSGNIKTELGIGTCNLNMKFPEDSNIKPSYIGEFSLDKFDVGKFYNISPTVGFITCSASIDGSGFTISDLDTKIDALINTVEYKSYTYSNITANGKFGHKSFNGNIAVADPNVELNLAGIIDFGGKLPHFSFESIIKNANLQPLHFDTVPSTITTNLSLDITGNSAKNIEGGIILKNLAIYRNKKLFQTNSIAFHTSSNDRNSSLSIKSEILDLDLGGQYNLGTLPVAMNNFFNHYFPDYATSQPIAFDHNFNFKLNIKNTKPITDLLFSRMKIGIGDVEGDYNKADENLKLSIICSEFAWDNVSFKGINFTTNKPQREDFINIKGSIRKMNLNDSINFDITNLEATMNNGSIVFKMDCDKDLNNYGFDLKGNIRLGHDTILVYFDSSGVWAYEEQFKIRNDSRFYYLHGKYIVPEFNILQGETYVSLDGEISNSYESGLNIRCHYFNLDIINGFVKTVQGGMHGQASGLIYINKLMDNPIITANLNVFQFVLGTDTIGDMDFKTKYDQGKNLLYPNIKVLAGYMKDLEIKGTVNLSKNNVLDLDLNLPDVDLSRFESYAKFLGSNLKGKATAKLKVNGTLKETIITGIVAIEEAALTIDYLKTRYIIYNHVVKLEKNYIDLGTVAVFENRPLAKGTAVLEGKIYHKNYDRYELNFALNKCRNIMCLNTNEKDNALFYGVAFASGSARFTGPVDHIQMDINARSEKGTNIYIPINYDKGSDVSDFIQFTSKDTAKIKKKTTAKKTKDESGFVMNFNMEVTRDAEVQLIFDKAINDIIKGEGYGNLKLEIDSRGEFKMYGLYTIEKGEYLFTALNIYNKLFKIKSGGTLLWDGDPFKAQMNMVAYNQIKASPAPLLNSSGGGSQLVTVNTIMYLRGLLLQPEIKFGLEFPDIANQNSDNNTFLITALKQIESDPEELNRQVFSLLFVKSFLPRQGSSSGTVTVGAITSGGVNGSINDLLSAQASNWLSQVFPGWEVTINYQSANPTQARATIFGFMKTITTNKFGDFIVEANYNFDNTQLGYASAQYLITKDGNFRVNIFNRNTSNPVLSQNVMTNGVGLFYRREFEYIIPKKKEAENSGH